MMAGCHNNPGPADAGPPPADLASPIQDLSVSRDLVVPPDLSPTLTVRAMKGLSIAPFTLNVGNLPLQMQEQIGIGSYLVNAGGGCAGCHGSGTGKYLSGGAMTTPGGNTVYSRNLTPDPATGLQLTEDDFVTVLRTNLDKKTGGALLGMPTTFRWMSTYDLKAIYAYLKQVPAVTNAVPADTKPVGAPTPLPASFNEGDLDRPVPADDATDTISAVRGLALQPLADPVALATFTAAQKALFGRGAYLVTTVVGCNNCHTNPSRIGAKINTAAYLSGGRVFALNSAALKIQRAMTTNLSGMTNAVKFNAMTFHDIIVQYKHVDDTAMRPLAAPMPKDLQNLVDEDLMALFTYFSSVPRRTAANDKVTQDYARYCTMATQAADCDAGETCNATTNECVGKTCAADGECDACQTCSVGKKCVAPVAGSSCVTGGI